MLDILINAFTVDQFVIAMAGQFVNEGSAKLTLTAIKALGITIMGVALNRGKPKRDASKRSKRSRKNKKRTRARARNEKKHLTTRRARAQADKRMRATR